MIELYLNTITENVEGGAAKAADEVCHFAQNDPYGLLMAVLGMGIVFTILLLLFTVFTNTPRLYTPEFKAQLAAFFTFKKQQQTPVEEQSPTASKREDLSGEVNAAIAAAIHLYRSELHDYENTVLTINKVSRTYSPWNSKIYGLRNVIKK